MFPAWRQGLGFTLLYLQHLEKYMLNKYIWMIYWILICIRRSYSWLSSSSSSVHKNKIWRQEVDGPRLREERLVWSGRVRLTRCKGQRDGKGLPTETGGLSVALHEGLLPFLIKLGPREGTKGLICPSSG